MILIGVAVIIACAVNIKPSKAADEPTATPTILGGAVAEYTGQSQKIVTDLPDGMRYYITTEQIDPTTIDAGKIVPVGYTALDYLQGTGTQYIDTEFVTNTGMVTKYAALYQATEQERGSFTATVVGVGTSTGYRSVFYPHSVTDNQLRWELWHHVDQSNYANTYYYGNTLEQKYSIEFSTVNSHIYADINGDRLVSAHTSHPYQIGNFDSGKVWLYTSSPEFPAAKVMLYYATVYNSDGKLVRDFVPVRDTAGTLGMYDLANDKFYQNDGTGDFVAGDEVNTAIKNWEWLDSVDDEQNNVTLQANTKYYVYYYTPNTDSTTVTPLAVKEFYVNCTNHVYGDWTITTPATCTTDGVREHSCTGCGHTESEVIPATGHDYQIADDVPATCTEAGYTRYECIHCHDDYQTSGAEQKPLGHQYLPENVTQPSCTEVGYTTHTCERCGHSYQSDYVPATGHNYSTWTTTEPATTEHAGEQKRTCEHCGAEQVRTIPALAGTTTDGGKDNTAPLLWGIIIGVIAVLAGCGGLAWLLIVLFKPKKKEKVAAA